MRSLVSGEIAMDQKLRVALNSGLVRQSIDEIWNSGNLAHVDVVVHPEYQVHMPGDQTAKGIDAYKNIVRNFRSAMPDVKMVIEKIDSDGEFVYVTSRMEGTQTGELRIAEGRVIPPSNQQITSRGISRLRLDENYKIIEEWVQWDEASALDKLNASGERVAYT